MAEISDRTSADVGFEARAEQIKAQDAAKIEAAKRLNRDFVQLYPKAFSALETMLAAGDTGPTRLWLLFARSIDTTHGAVVASQSDLAEILGVSTRTIQRWVAKLVQDRRVVVASMGSALGAAHVYAIDPDLAWRSIDGAKRGAAFNATVLAGREMQNSIAVGLKVLAARNAENKPKRGRAGIAIKKQPPIAAAVEEEDPRQMRIPGTELAGGA
jgi:hypothetical protein